MLKDLFIISQIKKGDIKAFEQLFRQYYSPLCLYAMSIVGEREGRKKLSKSCSIPFGGTGRSWGSSCPLKAICTLPYATDA